MTEPTSASATAGAPLSLISRIIGVVTSPKATFENVVAFPRPAGILLVVALVIGVASSIPQFTEAGRAAVLDMQIKAAERSGPVTPEAMARIEQISKFIPYFAIVGSLIFLPVVALIMSAIYWAVFNTVLGGTAAFKQVMAVVTHSQVIRALGVVVALPILLMKPAATIGGPFNLGALVPMLEQGSRLATFLSSVGVFDLWAVFVTSTGLAVLYRKKTMSVFIVLLAFYLLLTFGLSALFPR